MLLTNQLVPAISLLSNQCTELFFAVFVEMICWNSFSFIVRLSYQCFYLTWKLPSHPGSGYPCDLNNVVPHAQSVLMGICTVSWQLTVHSTVLAWKQNSFILVYLVLA